MSSISLQEKLKPSAFPEVFRHQRLGGFEALGGFKTGAEAFADSGCDLIDWAPRHKARRSWPQSTTYGHQETESSSQRTEVKKLFPNKGDQ